MLSEMNITCMPNEIQVFKLVMFSVFMFFNDTSYKGNDSALGFLDENLKDGFFTVLLGVKLILGS